MRTLVLAIILLVSGCAMLPARAPELRLTDARLVRSGLLTQGWELQLELSNLNWHALTLRQLEYGIFLDGEPLATELQADRLHLPARSRVTLRVPVNNFLGDSLRRRRHSSRARGDPMPYRVTGTALWGNTGDKRELSGRGAIRLPVYP